MALHAIFQLRDAGIAAVLTEIMTTLTPIVNGLYVYGMAEIDGLFLFGIKDSREYYPPDNQTHNKGREKGNYWYDKFPGPWFLRFV